MKAQMNTPWIIFKVMMVMTIVALAVSARLGCSLTESERVASAKTQLSAILQLTYENGGKATALQP